MKAEEYTNLMMTSLEKGAGKMVFQKMSEGFNGQIPLLMKLLELEEEGKEVKAGYLAEEFAVSTARIATILNKLESQGLIERVNSKSDRRITVVVLTKAGKNEIEEFKRKNLLFVEELLKGINDDDIMTFVNVLKQMCENTLRIIEEREKRNA